jgi:N-methylhydantoinase A
MAGTRHLLTIDMGGTSTDISITQDGEVDIVKNVDVSRYRLGIPLVNVVSIGAGGGSIAWLDAKKILRVGPQSAEAVPGPACYGRGGNEATVTDALVVLGYLNPHHLLGGAFRLDSAAAAEVVSAKVARPLGLSLDKAALGIHDVVNANMVGGIRAVSVERGYDPRDFMLVAGGGATSAHVARLAADLGIERIIVPKLASGLCAFGEAIADVKHSQLATYITRFDTIDLATLNDVLARLEQEGRAALRLEGFADADMIVKRTLDMRYADQVHECSVAIPATGDIGRAELDTIKLLFHKRHEQLYTYSERDNEPEIVNVEVTVLGPSRSSAALHDAGEPAAATYSPRSDAVRPAYFEEAGAFVPTPVHDGSHLNAGASLAGPLIVEEPTTTIVVPPGWTIECRRGGFYLLTHLSGAA